MRFVKLATLQSLPLRYRLLWVGMLIYLSTVGCLLWSWSQTVDQQSRLRADQFGSTLVAQLAALSSESLIVNDRIRLSVLANRLATLTEIEGVSIATEDGRQVALAGSLVKSNKSLVYRKTISFENMVAGSVEVILSQDAFRVPISEQIIPPLVFSLLVSLLLIGVVGFLPEILARRPEVIEISQDLENPEDDSSMYVLVVNLFNQISIPQEIRQTLLEIALQQAKRVANLYSGRAELLPGTGLLLAFDGAAEGAAQEDRCFQVLCAALLLQNLLHALSHESVAKAHPRLNFRFGLHLYSGLGPSSDDSGSPPVDRFEMLMATDEIADAVLLSAVATDDSLAISADVYHLLQDPNRIVAEQLTLPVLSSLATAIPDSCYVVRDVAAPYQPLLDSQADLMLAQYSAQNLDAPPDQQNSGYSI